MNYHFEMGIEFDLFNEFCVYNLGLPRDLAYRLASQTVLGSGQLVRDSAIHPGKLKDDVTSPAGSTASGLWHLEANGLYFSLIKMILMRFYRRNSFNNIRLF